MSMRLVNLTCLIRLHIRIFGLILCLCLYLLGLLLILRIDKRKLINLLILLGLISILLCPIRLF